VRFLLMLLALIGAAWSVTPAAARIAPGAAPLVAEEKTDTTEDEKQSEDAEAEKTDAEEGAEQEEEITLERFFPEKSFWGPSARSLSFSPDGRHAAYLYRPYKERRHGNDLWIYDFETGKTKRVTSVSVMSKFQEATRKVREDRIKKAKKDGAGKKTKKDGAKKQDETQDAAAPDLVTGEWEGKLTEGEDIGLPPEGLDFTLVLEMNENNKVSGTMTTVINVTTVTAGSFDPESGTITCELVEPESGLTGNLNAVIKDESMTGTLGIPTMNVELKLEAKRTVIGKAEDDEKATDDEDVSDEEGQGDEQTEEQEQDTEDQEDVEEEEEIDLGDIVSDKDADDEKAPRYGGVSRYTWSDDGSRMIITSAGDLYLYEVADESLVRLTKSTAGEGGVQFLPDGSGYIYNDDGALMRVTFGSHVIEQIDPRLPGGERTRTYRISPDGRKIAVMTQKGPGVWSGGKTVNIVTYRNRFAQVRQVGRHMPDDPVGDSEISIFIYQLGDATTEQSELTKVHTFKETSFRDHVSVPAWSPDSSRITFATYSQKSGQVQILEATLPEPDVEDGVEAEEPPAENEATESAPADEDEEQNGDEQTDDAEAEDDPDAFVELDLKPAEKARIIYRFFHNGGPNTPGMINPVYLADSRRMTFITELSGFRQLHTLDPTWEQLDQVTSGRYEVYPIGMSEDHSRMYVSATKEHPAQRDVYEIDYDNGTMTRLTSVDGTYSGVAVSDDGSRILATFIDFGQPRELVAVREGVEELEFLTDSHPEEAHKLTQWAPELFTYKNRHGQDIHGHMFKPDDWTPEDKRPLLIYVYGGPLGTGKMVNRGSFSGDSYYFALYMTKVHGYVTCTIDPRGASGYGGLFEKSNFEQVGKPQVEDLVDGAKWMIKHQGVDAERVGIHGWSFGGFQTQMCMYTEPDVFAVGIAGAGPTEWHNYNSWYSTGTIGESKTGKTDLEKYSLLPIAKNLKGRLLLIHGMEDSNVLYQDTVRVYRELLKAGKETLVELFLDPTGGHGLGGDVKSIGRFRKYEEFLVRNLGEGAPACCGECEDGAHEHEDGHEHDDADTEGDAAGDAETG
jgi:dipeptidyl-peptidase-4